MLPTLGCVRLLGPRGLLLLSVAVVMLIVAACGSGGTTNASPSPGTVIARVGSTTITEAQFDVRLQSTLTTLQQGGAPTSEAQMVSQIRAGVLRSLILDAVIAQEAAARGLAATSAEVQAQIEKDAQAAGGMSNLQTQLAGAGGSLAQLQDEIRSQLNEERLENVFAEARAAEVEQQLAGGASFTTLATSMSDDTGTNAKGGDLGVITRADFGSYDPRFIAAMQAMRVGSYSATPVHDSGGYDILQVYARTTSSWSVRHILIAAPTPYTVTSRPTWFAEALFATVAQLCGAGAIHVYITDAGANPCTGAPQLSPSPTPR